MEWTGDPSQTYPINNLDAPQWSAPNATYKDVEIFFQSLRQNAKYYKQYENLKIGMAVIGWNNIYNVQNGPFQKRHPELYMNAHEFAVGFDTHMTKDNYPYASAPNGVAANTSALELFGKQWANLSQYLGLNALVLRDGMSTVTNYQRSGPFGRNASMNISENQLWIDKNKKLFREMKKGCAAMNCDIIGYSAASSAVGEWMIGLTDVEELVADGYIDIWADQSWSGAWEDVPTRLTKGLGWTPQLYYIMAHRAQIVRGNKKRTLNGKCKHFVLHDTFDAYEGWDTIHNVPNKFKWGIWAYHHVAYLDVNPYEYVIADGSYLSWANSWNYVTNGKGYLSNPLGLLTATDIEFITSHLNKAEYSALNMNKIYSPILLYDRISLELVMNNTINPTYNFNQWFDEQLGLLSKFGFPCLLIGDINNLNEYYVKDAKLLNLYGFIFHGGNRSDNNVLIYDTIKNIEQQNMPVYLIGTLNSYNQSMMRQLFNIQTNNMYDIKGNSHMIDVEINANIANILSQNIDLKQQISVNNYVGVELIDDSYSDEIQYVSINNKSILMIGNNFSNSNSSHVLWTQLNDWYLNSEDLSVQNLGNSGLYQLFVNDYFYFYRNYYPMYFQGNTNTNLTVIFPSDEIDETTAFAFHVWKSGNRMQLLFGNLESSFCKNYQCTVNGNGTMWKLINMTMIQINSHYNKDICGDDTLCIKLKNLDGFQSDQIIYGNENGTFAKYEFSIALETNQSHVYQIESCH
eukprot:335125_1